MPCGVCGKLGHNNLTCPYNLKRKSISTELQKSKRCQCCGQYGYAIERHHTLGRGSDRGFLDVCKDCHLICCHSGNFRNLPKKPRVCRINNDTCFWRL